MERPVPPRPADQRLAIRLQPEATPAPAQQLLAGCPLFLPQLTTSFFDSPSENPNRAQRQDHHLSLARCHCQSWILQKPASTSRRGWPSQKDSEPGLPLPPTLRIAPKQSNDCPSRCSCTSPTLICTSSPAIALFVCTYGALGAARHLGHSTTASKIAQGSDSTR